MTMKMAFAVMANQGWFWRGGGIRERPPSQFCPYFLSVGATFACVYDTNFATIFAKPQSFMLKTMTWLQKGINVPFRNKHRIGLGVYLFHPFFVNKSCTSIFFPTENSNTTTNVSGFVFDTNTYSKSSVCTLVEVFLYQLPSDVMPTQRFGNLETFKTSCG